MTRFAGDEPGVCHEFDGDRHGDVPQRESSPFGNNSRDASRMSVATDASRTRRRPYTGPPVREPRGNVQVSIVPSDATGRFGYRLIKYAVFVRTIPPILCRGGRWPVTV